MTCMNLSWKIFALEPAFNLFLTPSHPIAIISIPHSDINPITPVSVMFVWDYILALSCSLPCRLPAWHASTWAQTSYHKYSIELSSRFIAHLHPHQLHVPDDMPDLFCTTLPSSQAFYLFFSRRPIKFLLKMSSRFCLCLQFSCVQTAYYLMRLTKSH